MPEQGSSSSGLPGGERLTNVAAHVGVVDDDATLAETWTASTRDVRRCLSQRRAWPTGQVIGGGTATAPTDGRHL